ncbi:DUF2029 domain-containing protein [bacterium]|nr:DUF2029 domain-containing protein [bacterium]
MSTLSQSFLHHWIAGPARGVRSSEFQGTILRWRGLLSAVVLFFLIVGSYYVGIKGEGRSAVNRWRPQVLELWTGQDIYLTHGFPTPPIMVMTLTPFCLLSGPATMAAWFFFKAVITLVVIVWMLQVVERTHGTLPRWGAAAALIFASRPVMGDLLHGNVNLWIMFLVMASVMAFRHQQDVWAGLSLSLAIACKLTPALLLIYFAWKRAWGMVLATIAGLILWLVIVPGIVFGFERNHQLLTHWADYMVWPYVQSGQVETEQTNQSAVALLHRFFARGQSPTSSGGSDTILTVDAESLRWVWKFTVVLVLAGLASICRRRWQSRLSAGWLYEIGIVLLVMLMLSERSWKHHFVWLLPISFVLIGSMIELRRFNPYSRRPWIVGICLLCAFLLMAGTSQDIVRPIAGEAGAKAFQSYGAYVWASILLVIAHITLLQNVDDGSLRRNAKIGAD